MIERIPEGARLRVTLECVCYYDDGASTVSVRVGDDYGQRISVQRDQIESIRAPIQRAGAAVWHVAEEHRFTVVMHDPEAACYVLRGERGGLHVYADDDNIIPAAEAAELRGAVEADQ